MTSRDLIVLLACMLASSLIVAGGEDATDSLFGLAGSASAAVSSDGGVITDVAALKAAAAEEAVRRVLEADVADEKRQERLLEEQQLKRLSRELLEKAEHARLGSNGVGRDPVAALKLYREAAAVNVGTGSAASMATLARMYEIGWDGISDLRTVPVPEHSGHVSWIDGIMHWLNLSGRSYRAPRAVTARNTNASVGSASTNGVLAGRLVPADIGEAVRLYNQSAALGNETAQFVVGVLYAHGLFGFPLDESKAVLHYYFAALGGSQDAQLALSYRHENGIGVPRSCPSAVLYAEGPAAAAATAVEESFSLLMYMPKLHSDRLSDEVLEGIHSDISRAESQIVSFYHNAADKGDNNAQVALGHLYLLGVKGVKQDLAAAAEHFLAAAGEHDLLSMSNLGLMYLHGLGVEADPATAAAFLKAPVEDSLPIALNTMGYMHWHGIGVEKDADKAFSMFKKAAEGGYVDSVYNIALMHMKGEPPIQRDFRAAVQHFRVAAAQGHVPSLVKLGKLQAAGIGTARDCQSALINFRQAILRGPILVAVPNGYRLLAGGNVDGSLLEYARAAEMGSEVAQWSAGYLLDEGLVPLAAAHEANRISWAAGSADVSSSDVPTDAAPSASSDTKSTNAAANDTATELSLTSIFFGKWRGMQEFLAPRPARRSVAAEHRALRLFMRAASQANGAADLRVGDYQLYGRGGIQGSAEAAAERYRAACNYHIAQACFNLGWMHELGHGVPPDAHLAKRYYDLTVEAQKAGRSAGIVTGMSPLPVRLMLARLQGRGVLRKLRDEVIMPVLGWAGYNDNATIEWIDGLLGLPPRGSEPAPEPSPSPTPTPSPGTAKKAKKQKAAAGASAPNAAASASDSTGAVAGQSAAGDAPSTAASSSSSSSGGSPPDASVDAHDRIQSALSKAKAARAAKQRSGAAAQMFSTGADAVAATYSQAVAMAEDILAWLASMAHAVVMSCARVLGMQQKAVSMGTEDSLLLLLAVLLALVVWIRGFRRRLAAAEVAPVAAAALVQAGPVPPAAGAAIPAGR